MSEDTLRPDTWDDFIGQEPLKAELQVRMAAALELGTALDPVLLHGPAGFGKTSLARIIGEGMFADFESFTMPITTATLTNIVRQFDGVLLLDEIHRASKKQQEELLPLLEFNYIQDSSGRRIHAGLLMIVGATTERQSLIKPLFDRFLIKPEFDDYSDEDMGSIVRGMAVKAGVELDDETCIQFGRAAAGTPRNARQLVLTARDLTAVNKSTPTAQEVFDLCRVDESGLSVQHVRYIETLSRLGGKAGVKTLGNLLRLNESVVTELERLLLTSGYMELTDRGRVLTRKGHQFLKERSKGGA